MSMDDLRWALIQCCFSPLAYFVHSHGLLLRLRLESRPPCLLRAALEAPKERCFQAAVPAMQTQSAKPLVAWGPNQSLYSPPAIIR